MGHVTIVAATPELAVRDAARVAAALVMSLPS
jgi:hypothetical protein